MNRMKKKHANKIRIGTSSLIYCNIEFGLFHFYATRKSQYNKIYFKRIYMRLQYIAAAKTKGQIKCKIKHSSQMVQHERKKRERAREREREREMVW